MTICVWIIDWFWILLSIPTIILSIKAKNKNLLKGIAVVSIVYVIYSILLNMLSLSLTMSNIFSFGWELNFFVMSCISKILYIISAILSIRKIKCDKSASEKSKKIWIVAAVLLAVPVLALSAVFFKGYYLIQNSDLVLVFLSKNGGGSLSGWQTFSYAINGDKCEQFDIGRKIENFLPENAEYLGYINTTNNNVFLDGYHIVQNDMHNIEIYKNDKLICHTVSPFEDICIMDAKAYINKVR